MIDEEGDGIVVFSLSAVKVDLHEHVYNLADLCME